MRTTPNDLIVPKGFDTVITRPSINRHDAMRGLVEGVSYVGKFGYRNVNTAAGGDETLWADNSNFVIIFWTRCNFLHNGYFTRQHSKFI